MPREIRLISPSEWRGSLLAQHRWLIVVPTRSVLFVGLVGFAIAFVFTISRGFPTAPEIHDEFSYLLASDTFVRGRLTNPPHPRWEHFESFHILQRPTYATKYPPAPALSLALGQLLTGEPTVGVWIAYALLCAVLTWMLQAWAPARWALWGGLFAALWLAGLHAGKGYWAFSFWGGTTAATGGALVLGGLRRVMDSTGPGGSAAMGIGLAILAASRPFEGLLAAVLPLCLFVVWGLRRIKQPTRRGTLSALLPVMVLVVLTGGFLGYYNFRVTGSPTRFPYVAYEQQYGSTPLLRGLSASPPQTYRHEVMRRFYAALISKASPPASIFQFGVNIWRDSLTVRQFLFPFFVVPLLFLLPWALMDPWTVLAAGCCIIVGAGLLLVPWNWQPHYVAPLFGAYLLLLVRSARHLRAVRARRARTGRVVLSLIVACTAASALLSIGVRIPTRRARQERWEWQRDRTERRLAKSGLRHLVIVEYGAAHDPGREWVYNRANIDASPVVWARSMGAVKDAQLLKYFANRSVWRLRIVDDNGPFVLQSLLPAPLAHGESTGGDMGDSLDARDPTGDTTTRTSKRSDGRR